MPDRQSARTKRQSVVIVQPYLPAYRVEFFSRLIDALDKDDIDCIVAAAEPSQEQKARGDSVREEWVRPFRQRSLKFAGKTIGLGGARRSWTDADAVVIGHLGSSVDTYLAVWDSMRGRIKVGLWGHIKSYVNDGFPLDIALERWQLRRAGHVFAYVPSGRDFAVSAGVEPRRITTVMNTVDTSRLAEARDSLGSQTVTEFAQKHELVRGRVLGYIGGLDESKRIDFLASALENLWATDPDVRVLVGGQGVQSDLLKAAVARGQVIMMGYVKAKEQALIGSLSTAFVMPGRVGLVAVDALVLGVPILTTNWKYHAPEFEYLIEGVTRFTAEDDAIAFADLMRFILQSPQIKSMTQGKIPAQHPSIEDMVANFRVGVLQLLND
jgi:glycosyltransferase involved in cell wall biosynthesis